MNKKRTARRWEVIALALLAAGRLHADDATWNKSAGGTYDWTNVVNWLPNTTIPNGAGQSAGFTNDITAGQTVQLRKNITVGTLAIGDAVASGNNYGFTLNNNGSETYVLTFDSGVAGVPAKVITGSSGTPTANLNAPMALSSDLLVNIGGADSANRPTLSFGGVTALNGHTITFTNGVAGQNQITYSGDFSGSGTLVNNAQTVVSLSNGGKAFGGRIIANKGVGGSNTGSFTLTNGGLTNVAEIVINGYFTNGLNQLGGLVHSGNGSAAANNPGQRWTTKQVTLNGGSLDDGGQSATVGTANDWQKGLEYVRDNMATVLVNSAYCYVGVNASASTTGTILNVGALVRNPGATVYMNGPNASNKVFLAGNGTNYLKGAGVLAGSQTNSVIPWMGSFLSGNSSNPGGFATYVEGAGVRGLKDAEYTNSAAAGPAYNVSITSLSLTNDITVNALRLEYLNAPNNNIGTNRALTVASGGVFFQVGDKFLGVSGSPNAGTLNFGAAEGVVWVLGNGTNTIGAKITGTGGVTKTGTGVLVLTGANSYSGASHVSGGTLRVGDGTYASNLGGGNVDVHVGAVLSLACSTALADAATVSVHRYGLYNGRLQLDAGVSETVKFLYLAGSGMPSGTYGATGSGAANIRDDFFSGTGVLNVTGNADEVSNGTVMRVL